MDIARRRTLQTGIALAVGALWPHAFAADRDAPIARTRSGRVRGLRETSTHAADVLSFKGITYGADTATTRFLPPQRETPWRGVRDALRYAASAPQSGELGPGSEDCLALNVWTPALRDNGKRPVLVYIHGGGYDTGSCCDIVIEWCRV